MRFSLPRLNQAILLIVIADFVLITGFGFLSPIFAIFVADEIAGASVATVGFAIMIYWGVKSVLQLFVARRIDKNHGEIDDFYFMIAGGILSSLFVSLYYFADSVWHIYLLQFLIGVADSLLVPPFYAIFTRHIDKGNEGFEWALYSSFSLGAGSALGGALGGILAIVVGTRAMFPFAGAVGLIATIMFIFLRPYIRPRVPGDQARIYIEKKKI